MLRKFLARTLLFSLCAGLPLMACADSDPLTWVGCGITKKAFMAELAAAYQKQAGVTIDMAGGGATKGIRSVASGEVDMGGSCRNRLPDSELEEGIKLNPVAWDALVVVVHPDNPLQNISIADLRKVYLGKITNWRELGGPDQPIQLLVRQGRISGVGRTIRELLFGDLNMNFPSRHVYKSTGPLEEATESEPWALAISGISSARRRAVKILTLEGKEPDYANIRSGDYLLYRPLYIVTNHSSPHYSQVRKFLEFAHSTEGRDIIRANGVVPYLEATHLIRKQRQQWEESRELSRERG